MVDVVAVLVDRYVSDPEADVAQLEGQLDLLFGLVEPPVEDFIGVSLPHLLMQDEVARIAAANDQIPLF